MKLAPTLVLLVVSLSSPVVAQDRSADETAIRDLIAKEDAGRRAEVRSTEDLVFWSGAYVRPFVGKEKGEVRPGSSAGQRTNETRQTTVRLLRVSPAGEMAYEHSLVRQSWDRTDTKQHVEFEAALLRVWVKEQNQWKVAAFFQRPIENTPSTR